MFWHPVSVALQSVLVMFSEVSHPEVLAWRLLTKLQIETTVPN